MFEQAGRFLAAHKFYLAILLAGGATTTTAMMPDTTALFTDEVTVNNQQAGTAVLKIGAAPVSQSFNITDMVPGDSVSRTVKVENTGNVGLTYQITNTLTNNSLLSTNAVSGLQLTITGTNGSYYSGPIGGLNAQALSVDPDVPATTAFSRTLAKQTNEVLTFTITLPKSADNTYQNLTQDIVFVFNATQLPGTGR